MDKDCYERICAKDQHAQYRNLYKQKIEQESSMKKTNEKSQSSNTVETHDCPLVRSQLGYYSWSLMHTFAAYYPQQPTQSDQQHMRGFLQGFKYLFPCAHCRPHFIKDYDRDPPTLTNRNDLSLWVCRQHNYVNKLIRKPQIECDVDWLMRRWRTGCSETQDEL